MPKTNDNTGATYAGQEGIVEHADGSLSELDPSRNVDGSPVDGYESDEDEKPEDLLAAFDEAEEKGKTGRGSRSPKK